MFANKAVKPRGFDEQAQGLPEGGGAAVCIPLLTPGSFNSYLLPSERWTSCSWTGNNELFNTTHLNDICDAYYTESPNS